MMGCRPLASSIQRITMFTEGKTLHQFAFGVGVFHGEREPLRIAEAKFVDGAHAGDA